MAAKIEELSIVLSWLVSISLHDIEQLCAMYHIIFLQETWLAKQTLDKLTDISDNHFACGTAEVDYTEGITSGRPYGGTAILWNKKLYAKIFMNQPRPKYHWSGGVPRLKLFELHKCFHATLLL